MAIISISRGSATGGLLLAEGLAKSLNYKVVRREDILQGTVRFGFAAAKLEKYLFGPPTFSDDYKHDIRNYLALFQAALFESIQKADVIYIGNVGHMLLRDIACVLRIRLIAPREFRIKMLVERRSMTPEEASAYIDKVDAQRRAWTLLLYGVDWLNPSLYDLTLNLEGMSIDAAVDIAATAARHRRLAETDQCLASFDNMLLASRTRAELVADPQTSAVEIEVKANAATATVFLTGKVPADLRMQAISIAEKVPGIQIVDAHNLETLDSE